MKKHSHDTTESTKNLQEAEHEVLTADRSPLLGAATMGIVGEEYDCNPVPFATEALTTIERELTVLHFAASNADMPLADTHVHDMIYRIAQRARAASSLTSQMGKALMTSIKNGGAK